MSKYDFKEIDNSYFALWEISWCNFIHCHVSGLEVDFIPTDLFAALLSHPIYERGYTGSDTAEPLDPLELECLRQQDNVIILPDRHGPFRLDRLSPSDFVEISFEEWTKRIHARYADPDYETPPDTAQIEAIDAYLNRLPKAGMRYFRLAVPHEGPYHYDDPKYYDGTCTPTQYHHEFWYFHDFFDEYILVNPQHQSLWIMVLSED